jgi:hypothetical protein
MQFNGTTLCRRQFYVELYYDPIANKILSFRSFTDKQLLTPYLAHINLICTNNRIFGYRRDYE